MIQTKILYYKEKIEKDRLKKTKLETLINKLSQLSSSDIDRYGVSNSDRLIQSKIKKIETEGDIIKVSNIIK